MALTNCTCSEIVHCHSTEHGVHVHVTDQVNSITVIE